MVISSLLIGQNDDYYKTLDKLSPESFYRRLSTLASDDFEGRGTGQPGGEKAARYIESEFKAAGLKPANSGGSFFQPIRMHGNTTLPGSELLLFDGKDTIKLQFGDEYLLYKTGDQTFTPSPMPMVFAGYGIIAPEYDYNDYFNLDVTNKIVVLLSGEPLSEHQEYFEGPAPTIYSYPESKQRIAISRGARGSVIIPFPCCEKDWGEFINEFSFEDVIPASAVTGQLSIMINPDNADLLFSGSGLNLEKLNRMHQNNSVACRELNTMLSFRGKFKRRDFISNNVAGIVEGSDRELKDEYIIVSAHYDHLGIGPAVKGDSIYNGLQDNAAGAAALLELAERFNQLEKKPARSIIFIAVTGEEKGLLGSTYYTQNPLRPLFKTRANVNIDGLAVIDQFNAVIGVGSKLSTLDDYLQKTAAQMNMTVEDIPEMFSQWESFNRSDQMAFAKAGIPSILILDAPNYRNISIDEGLKRNLYYSNNLYHSPFDDLNQKINLKASVQHLKFLFSFIYNIADSPVGIEWKPEVPWNIVRFRNIAEKK